jgi:hypothetical protein
MNMFRRLMGVVVIIGALLYIPYGLYSARTQRLLAESAVPVRGAVVRTDEVTCERNGGKVTSYTCEVPVIADVNTNPPWTGRVVIDTTFSATEATGRELAREKLAAIKTRDVLSLYAVTRGGQAEYISEPRLAELKREGSPTNDLYLLFTPLFIILGASIVLRRR